MPKLRVLRVPADVISLACPDDDDDGGVRLPLLEEAAEADTQLGPPNPATARCWTSTLRKLRLAPPGDKHATWAPAEVQACTRLAALRLYSATYEDLARRAAADEGNEKSEEGDEDKDDEGVAEWLDPVEEVWQQDVQRRAVRKSSSSASAALVPLPPWQLPQVRKLHIANVAYALSPPLATTFPHLRYVLVF
jgi:hypothetical protein